MAGKTTFTQQKGERVCALPPRCAASARISTPSRAKIASRCAPSVMAKLSARWQGRDLGIRSREFRAGNRTSIFEEMDRFLSEIEAPPAASPPAPPAEPAPAKRVTPVRKRRVAKRKKRIIAKEGG